MLLVETADLNMLNEKVTEQYQVKFSNRFAAFGNLDYSGDRNRAWENIIYKIRITS